MSTHRAPLALIPASILVVGLLVGLELAPRQSAPTLDTANGSPAAVASESASGPSSTSEARVDGGAGNGEDGGTPVVATPASTEVNARVEGEWPIPPAAEVGVAPQSGDALRPSVGVTNAGSTPAPSATETATVVATALVAEPTTKDEATDFYHGDLWDAVVAAFPPSEQATAYRVAMCESRGDPDVVGRFGELGAWQVRPEFHGAVPADLYGQSQQASRIVSEHGWTIWSCY